MLCQISGLRKFRNVIIAIVTFYADFIIHPTSLGHDGRGSLRLLLLARPELTNRWRQSALPRSRQSEIQSPRWLWQRRSSRANRARTRGWLIAFDRITKEKKLAIRKRERGRQSIEVIACPLKILFDRSTNYLGCSDACLDPLVDQMYAIQNPRMIKRAPQKTCHGSWGKKIPRPATISMVAIMSPP